MPGTVVSAVLICLGTALIGQLVLYLCGARRWTWLAPSVGMSVAILAAVPARSVPGRATTASVVLAVAVAGAAFTAIRYPALRPPVPGLLATLPVLFLALLPFAVNGHAGTLGVSVNNDMAFHLGQADAYRSPAVERVTEVDDTYPVGPPALVAAVAQGLGVATEEAFAGLTMAGAVILAWTALAALRDARWYGQILVAALAGMPFIVAGYYGQGSFKELQQAALVLAVAIYLQRREEWQGPLQWVPGALLIAGIVSIYSMQGLVWPFAFVVLWLGGRLIALLKQRVSRSAVLESARTQVKPLAIGTAVLAGVLAPQIPRLVRFITSTVAANGTGIEKSNLGNVVGPIPVWQAFGIWDNADYRLPALDASAMRLWGMAVAVVVVAGAVWWLRRGEWVLPAAAGASMAIWFASDRTQSPYVSGKALVIASPLLMVLGSRWLVDFSHRRSDHRRLLQIAGVSVLAVMAVKINGSSINALRAAKVGPKAHLQELRQLQPLLKGGRTLFLGNDDYIRWELAGSQVDAPVIGFQAIRTRPEKPWTHGTALDLDSLDTTVLNRYRWIITPRDAAGSAPPEELHLVKSTRSFALWLRTATIPPRSVLPEGPAAGAVLDCSTPAGRQLEQEGGVAAVREPPVTAPVPALTPGAATEVSLALGAGTWELQAPYLSQHDLEVTGPGLSGTLPANLDRPGTRWRIGRIRLSAPTTVTLRIRVVEPPLAPSRPTSTVEAVIATPAAAPHLVSIGEACGKFVDWYRPSTP